MAFSPDGQILASMDPYQSTVRIWDVKTGEQIGQFGPDPSNRGRGYGPGPSLLAFSPGGDLLAAFGRDPSVRLWDVRARRLLHTVKGTARVFTTVAFSPDGRRLAAGGVRQGTAKDEGTIHIIDPVKGEVLANLPSDGFLLAFTPDGKTLLSADYPPSQDGKMTSRLWDVETGRKRSERTFLTEKHYIGELSPDGKLFAIPFKGGTGIRLLDPLTGEEVRRMEGKTSRAIQIAFSGDGRFLTASCDDGIVRVWESATGKTVHRFRGSSTGIHRVALSQKGDLLALVGRADWAVHVWDLSRERELHDFAGHRGGILTVAFSPDGKTLATTNRDSIRSGPTIREWDDWSLRLWDAATGEERGVTRRNSGGEVCITAFSPDGRILATVLHDGTLRLWDVAAGEELRRWKVPIMEGTTLWHIRTLTFPLDGQTVLATDGEMIYRWETATGKELPALKLGSRSMLTTCAVAPDGRTLLVSHEVSRRWRLTLVDLTSGRELWHRAAGGMADCLIFSWDSRTLAFTGADGASGVFLLEVENGQERGRLVCDSPGGFSTAFAPGCRLLASGRHLDGRVRLWDMSVGRVVQELDASLYHRYGSSLAFSPDGSRLASASSVDNTALVWDVLDIGKRGGAAAPRLSTDELESLWLDLAGVSASRAYRAVWKLAAAPRQSVPFLKSRLKAPPAFDEKHLTKLIGELDDDSFPIREKASRELEQLGAKAERALRQALARGPSTEARRRIEQLLEKFGGEDAPAPPSQELIALRVLETLERSESPESREAIGELAGGSPDSRLTREAAASLRRLEKRSAGKP
jgi:WD40 repeat protein